VDTSESAAALEAELRIVEEDLARLRETAADLRRRIGEREDEPTDPAERSALIEQAEEQEALIDMLEARREELRRELGRPGTGIGPAGRPRLWPRRLSGPGVLDRGEWQGNVLQGLALGMGGSGQLSGFPGSSGAGGTPRCCR
jgi:outer membrane protein TolC